VKIKGAPVTVWQAAVEQRMPSGGRFVVGRQASLLVSAGVVGHTLWTSAAPALTYGLYAQEWHLSARPDPRHAVPTASSASKITSRSP
jgi:hypothetical protein